MSRVGTCEYIFTPSLFAGVMYFGVGTFLRIGAAKT